MSDPPIVIQLPEKSKLPMDVELTQRAQAIQDRLVQLGDSL